MLSGVPPSLLVVLLAAGHCSALLDTPEVLRTPDSAFTKLPSVGYPWQPNYLQFQPEGFPLLRVHYIDEGPKNARETILLLHGTPSWSYLYRKVIPPLLQAGYRVVAPDFIGFGRSDKLRDIDRYTHTLHVLTLMELLNTLDLKDITLVGHDTGGPVGGSVMSRSLDRFVRVALVNTWFPQGDVFASAGRALQHSAYLAFRVTSQALGLHHPVSAIFLLGSKASITDVAGGYTAPFPDYRFQAGPASWPPMIPLFPGEDFAQEMQQVATFLQASWGTRPALVGYSAHEVFTRPGQQLLEGVFPGSCNVEIPMAGHFLQEDQGEAVASTLLAFVGGRCPTAP